jgi:hypothetical protein
VNVLEFLDRIGERRAQRMHRPRDIRQFIGFAFLSGYYVMVYQFTLGELPEKNVDLVRDAMLTLGPPIGIIIGAMFRSDAREEQATANTARAFQAIEATAKASTSTDGAANAANQVADAAIDEAERIERQP